MRTPPPGVGETHATDGRPIGARARATRRRLLDETARLLGRRGVTEVTVVEITRSVGTSPATFYQYFNDVDDAILHLASEVGERELDLIDLISDEWTGDRGFSRALAFVDAYADFWTEHRGVLRVRNLKSEEGDPRFQEVRSRSSIPMAEALGRLVRDGIERGRLSPTLDPFATGGAMLGMIERLFVYQKAFRQHGSTDTDIRLTLATVLHQVLAEPGWRGAPGTPR